MTNRRRKSNKKPTACNVDPAISSRTNFPIVEKHKIKQGFAYIVKHSETEDADLVVSTLDNHEFPVDGCFFADPFIRVPNTLVNIEMFSFEKSEGIFPSRVIALSEKQQDRIDDRLKDFKKYNENSLDFMRDLFEIGSCFRLCDGIMMKKKVEGDCVDLQVDEDVILKTLKCKHLLKGKNSKTSGSKELLDLIYKWDLAKQKENKRGSRMPIYKKDGSTFTLNCHQHLALSEYFHGEERAFCILSPPGSGKTTVAAVMAMYGGVNLNKGVQLLLSVQNVAVDNMGAALKGLRHAVEVYNAKALYKLDPDTPAPYDIFDDMDEESLDDFRDCKGALDSARYKKMIKEEKSDYENSKPYPEIVLATVETVLWRMFDKHSIFYKKVLSRVDRVIIDEASLLTESALFCLILRFPKAKFVFIGDDKQLPPFLYDPKILGHELAGRSALSVVMKNGNIPVIQLEEVYRAPPSLVEPYNRLSYKGKLISRKAEESGILSSLNLVPASLPQLLFVEVEGKQKKLPHKPSLYNESELRVLHRLLSNFPVKEDIMIICLYSEQKRRLEELLGAGYNILTVDSSQGKEKPIVILVTTRTKHADDLRFFCSKQRCTVAISREQRALIILGSSILTETYPWNTVVNSNFHRIRGDSIAMK